MENRQILGDFKMVLSKSGKDREICIANTDFFSLMPGSKINILLDIVKLVHNQ